MDLTNEILGKHVKEGAVDPVAVGMSREEFMDGFSKQWVEIAVLHIEESLCSYVKTTQYLKRLFILLTMTSKIDILEEMLTKLSFNNKFGSLLQAANMLFGRGSKQSLIITEYQQIKSLLTAKVDIKDINVTPRIKEMIVSDEEMRYDEPDFVNKGTDNSTVENAQGWELEFSMEDLEAYKELKDIISSDNKSSLTRSDYAAICSIINERWFNGGYKKNNAKHRIRSYVVNDGDEIIIRVLISSKSTIHKDRIMDVFPVYKTLCNIKQTKFSRENNKLDKLLHDSSIKEININSNGETRKVKILSRPQSLGTYIYEHKTKKYDTKSEVSKSVSNGYMLLDEDSGKIYPTPKIFVHEKLNETKLTAQSIRNGISNCLSGKQKTVCGVRLKKIELDKAAS